jgi:hypothetical protein
MIQHCTKKENISSFLYYSLDNDIPGEFIDLFSKMSNVIDKHLLLYYMKNWQKNSIIILLAKNIFFSGILL